MRKTILFIAMSLDGYIAKEDGSVDWLSGQDINADSMESYSVFIEDVDTIIMGWTTYHQIKTELSPDEWYYKGKQCYVITHRNEISTDEVTFVNEGPVTLIKSLQDLEGKKIWICGGADIVEQCVMQDMIDCYHISIIPTLIGKGIPLFKANDKEIKLKLIKTESYNGITDVVYERR